MADIRRDPPRPNGLPLHRGLGGGNSDPTKVIAVTLDFRCHTDGHLEFFLTPDDASLPDPLDIEVTEDCIIKITLSGTKKWRWSTLNQAITTKYVRDQMYERLRYLVGTDWKRWEELYSNVLYDIKTIKFRVDHNVVSHHDGEAHGINLNVEFDVPNVAPALRLPISIDPEVINPKPGNGFLKMLRLVEGREVPLFAVPLDAPELSSPEEQSAS